MTQCLGERSSNISLFFNEMTNVPVVILGEVSISRIPALFLLNDLKVIVLSSHGG